MDLRQSREYAEYMKKRGWGVVNIPTIEGKMVMAYTRKLFFLPLLVMKIQRYEGVLDLEKLEKIKKERRVVYTIIEPLRDDQTKTLTNFFYKRMSNPYLPSKTRVVKLKGKIELNVRSMSENVKRILRKENGVKVGLVKKSETEVFWRAFKKADKGYVPGKEELLALKRAFGKRAIFIKGVDKGKIVSGIVLLLTDDTAFYYYAFTTEEGRERNVSFKLVIEAMKVAIKMGRRWFDFEGVYDERFPRKDWKGFSEYKRKFGGSLRYFPGCFSRWF